MTQSRSGRYYYTPEDFKEKKQLPRWLWLVIFLAVIASYVAAAFIGAIVWEQKTHASARARAYVPVRLVVAQPAAIACTPFQCTAKDIAEHRQACKDRAVIALTKPKE